MLFLIKLDTPVAIDPSRSLEENYMRDILLNLLDHAKPLGNGEDYPITSENFPEKQENVKYTVTITDGQRGVVHATTQGKNVHLLSTTNDGQKSKVGDDTTRMPEDKTWFFITAGMNTELWSIVFYFPPEVAAGLFTNEESKAQESSAES